MNYSNILEINKSVTNSGRKIIDSVLVDYKFVNAYKKANPYLAYREKAGSQYWPPPSYPSSLHQWLDRWHKITKEYEEEGYCKAEKNLLNFTLNSDFSLIPYPMSNNPEGDVENYLKDINNMFLGEPSFTLGIWTNRKNMWIQSNFLPNFYYKYTASIATSPSDVAKFNPPLAFTNHNPFNLLSFDASTAGTFTNCPITPAVGGEGDVIVCNIFKNSNTYTLQQIGIASAGKQYVAPIDKSAFVNCIAIPCNSIKDQKRVSYLDLSEANDYQIQTITGEPSCENELVITCNGDIPALYVDETETYSASAHESMLEEEKINAIDLDTEYLGWILKDKKFINKEYVLQPFSHNSYFTLRRINVLTSEHVVDLSISFSLSADAVLDDGGISNVIEIDLSSCGVINCGLPGQSEIHSDKIIAYSRNGKGMIIMSMCQRDDNSAILVLNQLDIFASGDFRISDLTSGDIFNISVKLVLDPDQMDGNYCNQYFWTRTPEPEEETDEEEIPSVDQLNTYLVKNVDYSGPGDDIWLNANQTWGETGN